MHTIDKKKQARRIVSNRLRLFFSQLTDPLTASAGELWRRVESKLADQKPKKLP